MAILLGELFSLIPAFIHVLIIYFLLSNHRYAKPAVFYWALFYLLILTGVKAGGKTLVILGGNGWEIDTLRYCIDLFLVFLGIVVLLGRKWI